MLIKIKNKMGSIFNELGCLDFFRSRMLILLLDRHNTTTCAHRIPVDLPTILRDVCSSSLLHTGKLTRPGFRATK